MLLLVQHAAYRQTSEAVQHSAGTAVLSLLQEVKAQFCWTNQVHDKSVLLTSGIVLTSNRHNP